MKRCTAPAHARSDAHEQQQVQFSQQRKTSLAGLAARLVVNMRYFIAVSQFAWSRVSSILQSRFFIVIHVGKLLITPTIDGVVECHHCPSH